MEEEKKETEELFIITIPEKDYAENFQFFKSIGAKVKRVEVINEDHKGDVLHGKLLSTYLKARDKLREYEFNKRHNIKIK